MTHLNGSCKFCKQPLVLRVGDGYDVVSDPLKLVPLCACNRCANFRTNRRQISTIIFQIAAILTINRCTANVESARRNLSVMLSRYGKLVSEWMSLEPYVLDPGAVEAIIQQPNNVGDVLSAFWPNDGQVQARLPMVD